MQTWAHFSFRCHLIHKAKEFPNVHVFVVNESYTSKTCTNCGHIDENLKGKEVYECSACALKWGRDNNGARNILLRFLSQTDLVANQC